MLSDPGKWLSELERCENCCFSVACVLFCGNSQSHEFHFYPCILRCLTLHQQPMSWKLKRKHCIYWFQVASRTFIRALRERGSVILVPGGQAELVHTGRLTRNREFVIYPKHKGPLTLLKTKIPSSLVIPSQISTSWQGHPFEIGHH